MSTLADVQAKQAATDTAITGINTGITAVAADVKTLMDKIANFPAGGLTPEQQTAIDDIASHADIINTGLAGAASSLAAIDTSVNPPAATVA